jgi:hypothetical protein
VEYLPVTCELNDENVVLFDVPWTEADDHDATWTLYQMFQTTVGA